MALTNVWQNPGADGRFWKLPFQTTAQWVTSGASITALRNGAFGTPTGSMNLKGNFAVPFVQGQATDPLVTVQLGGKSIQVRMPLGTIVETPTSSVDQSIGGTDASQPGLVWSVSGANMNTGSVAASGSIITGGYGLQIDWGYGPFMEDIVTGQQGFGNSYGIIQDYELSQAVASSSYVIPHMLAISLDPSAQVNSTGPVWPLNIIDNSFPNNGPLPQGQTYGIPASTPRPTGMTRGQALLFDTMQQFGGFYYNVAGSGCMNIGCYANIAANQSLASDMANNMGWLMQFMCILANQTGVSSAKGMVNGVRSDAFPAPPLLDLTPIGGVEKSSATVGAYYSTTLAPYSAASGGFTNPAPSGSPTPTPPTPTPTPPTPTPPTPTPTPPTPTPTVSPNNTIVTTVGPTIVDSSLNVWALTGGLTVSLNGTVVGFTANVIELAYENGVVWQLNSAGNWYSFVFNAGVVAVGVGPTTTSPVPSPTPTPTPTPPTPSPTNPTQLLGVYIGNAPSSITLFENYIGRTIDLVHAFTDQQSSFSAIANPGFFTGEFQGTNRAVMWSIPMLPTDGSTLDLVANGSQNSTFIAAARVYAAYTPKSPGGVQYIRMGWEFQIGNPWQVTGSGTATAANFIGAWQNIVSSFRSVSSEFRFVWCPNSGNTPPDPATCYPGDAYVDVIGVDAYQFGQFNLTTFAQQLANNSRGVQWAYNFAQCIAGARTGTPKPFCIPEWGVSDPAASVTDAQGAQYVQDMYNWMAGTDQGNVPRVIALTSYWDGVSGSGYNSQLEGNAYPLTGAKFKTTFGKADLVYSTVTPTPTPTPTETATASFAAVALAGGIWQYTLTLNNTGATPIGTFWVAWVPGQGYLPSLPTITGSPAGWSAIITNGTPPTDGYSIQWKASTLLPAHSSITGFTFTIAASPTVLLGNSAIHTGVPILTSFIYQGVPESDAGYQLVITGVAGTGAFFVSNGQIIGPNGQPFLARGINVYTDNMAQASINAQVQPLTSLFPGINFVRLVFRDSWDTSSSVTNFINQVTAAGIVVECDDHVLGNSIQPATGATLTQELAWFTSLATTYKNNPYVWFGTQNEPYPTQTSNGNDVSVEQLATYNAVRNTGANNIIMLQLIGGGNLANLPGGGSFTLTASTYASMHNVIWDLHQYDYISGYSTSQSVCAQFLTNSINAVQTVTSGDGLVPVLIGEFGNSTSGSSVDPGGTQLVAAVMASGHGFAAFTWSVGTVGNALTQGSAPNFALTSPFGTQVAAGIAAAASASPTPTPPTPTPPTPTPTPPTPTPTKIRIPSPLTGVTVTKGSWVTNQRINVAAMPNGFMQYNYLLPFGYAPNSYVYPILFYGHENDEGMNGGSYPVDGGQLVSDGADGYFNTVAFRTNYPCIVVAPECDQSIDQSGANANANFGGYADGPNTGGNEQAVNAILQYMLANFSVDASRCYCTGDSLGAIGSLAWMVDNNQYNGIIKLWTAGLGLSDQLFRPNGQPTNTTFTNMTNVPYIAVSTPTDNNPAAYDQPAWTFYTGNSNYPSSTTYANGGIVACKAGSSQFYYLDTQISNPWDTYGNLNADGGQGTSLYNLLFSFIGPNSSLPTPTPTPPTPTPPTPTPPTPTVTRTFNDNFTALSLHDTFQSGDTWQLIAPDTTQGRGGVNFGEHGDQWWTNPFNTNTPVQGLYQLAVGGGLQLGLMQTPAADQAYINSQSGSSLPYVGALLNSSQTSDQLYGFWQITCSIPKIPGFTFQMDIENVQLTGQFPPEIDFRVFTSANNVQTVLYEVAVSGSNYLSYTTSSAAGFDASITHVYGFNWEPNFITFYIDNAQVFQVPTPTNSNYTSNPMFMFILTAANYLNNGDPAAASLPAYAKINNIQVWSGLPSLPTNPSGTPTPPPPTPTPTPPAPTPPTPTPPTPTPPTPTPPTPTPPTPTPPTPTPTPISSNNLTFSANQSLTLFDTTQPYKVWTFQPSSIKLNGISQNTITSGCIVTAVTGEVDDCSGSMEDQLTGDFGYEAGAGTIRHWQIVAATGNTQFTIQNSLKFGLGAQYLNAPPAWNNTTTANPTNPYGMPYIAWPQSHSDINGPTMYTGHVPVGCTVGIPSTVPMPVGLTQGGQILWNNAQQFGWRWRTSDTGNSQGLTLFAEPQDENNAIIAGMRTDLSTIVSNLCVLINQSGPTTLKGGGTPLYAPPPLLESFNTSATAISVNPPNAILNVPFIISGVLTGYSATNPLPVLTFADDGNAPQPFPSGFSESFNGFSFLHPALPLGNHVTIISDGVVQTAIHYNVGTGQNTLGQTTFIVSPLANTSTYTFPTNWNQLNNKIQAIGGGASGANFLAGGAGAFAGLTNYSALPTSNVSYVVGSGGQLQFTAVTSTNQSITDTANNVWTLINNTNNGFSVARNGITTYDLEPTGIIQITQVAILLLTFNNQMYYFDGTTWWQFNGTYWIMIPGDPRVGTSGGDTFFVSTGILLAKAGSAPVGNVGGIGGQASQCVGSITFNGGTAPQLTSSFSGQGGAGAAGPFGPGGLGQLGGFQPAGGGGPGGGAGSGFIGIQPNNTGPGSPGGNNSVGLGFGTAGLLTPSFGNPSGGNGQFGAGGGGSFGTAEQGTFVYPGGSGGIGTEFDNFHGSGGGGGGTGGTGGFMATPPGLLSAGGTRFADIGNIHLYPMDIKQNGIPLTAATVSPIYGNLINYKILGNFSTTNLGYIGSTPAQANALPIVITEFGYPAAGGFINGASVDVATQGKNILNGILNAWVQNINLVCIFELYDQGNHYGLMQTYGTPYTSATYLSNFTKILKDTGTNPLTFTPTTFNYTVLGATSTMNSIVVQKSTGNTQVILWNDVDNWNVGAGTANTPLATSVSISLGTTGASGTILVFDPTVGSFPVSIASGARTVTFFVRDYPMIVDFTNVINNSGGVLAQRTTDLVNIIGINGNVAGNSSIYINSGSSIVSDLQFLGIKIYRDGLQLSNPQLNIYKTLANAGIQMVLSPPNSSVNNVPYLLNVNSLVSEINTFSTFASNFIYAIEGPNKPNTYPIIFNGATSNSNTFMPVANFMNVYFNTVNSLPSYNTLPVYSVSDINTQPDNTGMQFLTIPNGLNTGGIAGPGGNYGGGGGGTSITNGVPGTGGQGIIVLTNIPPFAGFAWLDEITYNVLV